MHKTLVTDDDILDGEVTVRCAHGDSVSYPLAVVKINIGGKDIITTAAVSNTLPASVLLGWDVPQLINMVKTEALAVMTRQRGRQLRKAGDQPETDTQAAPSPPPRLQYRYQRLRIILSNLDDSLFSSAGPPRPIMTQSQKR